MIFLVLFIALIIFLFMFYFYARNDYFFLRKGITMHMLFDVLFIGAFWGVIIARIGYILLHPSMKYVNPLVFLLIPYYPGLSFLAGIVGFFIVVWFYTRRKKIQTSRFTDYASIAMLVTFPLFFSVVFMKLYLVVMYIVLFIFFINVLLPKLLKGTLREGSITILFLIMFALVSLLQDIILLYQKNVLLTVDDVLYIALFFISTILLIRIETKRSTK